ncbi:MAG: BMP family ABC transporter substrate-binding protein [Clostridiales bacterium]|nr:BMP family ABC transporter substrate-binding protein [Clostridiales bacterium]
MKKKVLLVTLLVVAIVASCFAFTACNKDKGDGDKGVKVAMITDYGDITDQSFNQTTYEACKAYCDANNIKFKYYKPTGDSTEARVASVNAAIAEGYTIIVMPGYAFGGTIVEVADNNPEIKFVALDVARGDLLEAKYGKEYDYNPDNPKWTYQLPSNVTCFVYQEEISGFMAGYAAVKEGYKKLGFLGGMAVPAVIRFGYGFVQGVNKAAVEMNIANEVSVNYVYGGKFNGTPEITAVMDTWYQGGTEVVFACGGGIFTSACEAATKAGVNGKVIGVDTDQSYIINGKYGAGLCITSAMKGLAPTVNTILTDIFAGKWENYAGKINKLGMVSGTDASLNYVQLPTDTWSMTNFTKADYATLVGKIFDGTITISDAIDKMPATTIKVTQQDNIH